MQEPKSPPPSTAEKGLKVQRARALCDPVGSRQHRSLSIAFREWETAFPESSEGGGRGQTGVGPSPLVLYEGHRVPPPRASVPSL